MRLNSIFFHSLVASAGLSTLFFRNVLAQRCDGAVATLYDDTITCDPAKRVKSCTWMYGDSCCMDVRPGSNQPGDNRYFPHDSASMYGIEGLEPEGPTFFSITTNATTRNCILHSAARMLKNGCLHQGGARTIYSAGWGICKDRPAMCTPTKLMEPVSVGAEKGGCNKVVRPDVYFVRETKNGAGIPLAESTVLMMNAVSSGVVDLETLVVREGMVQAFRDYIGSHGDGMSRQQIQAMSVLAREDEMNGILTENMARFLKGDEAERCRVSGEL